MRHQRIIINGDDFGFSSSVNHGIIEAYDRGVLTSTSLMVTGEACDEAVALAKKRPGLAVGLHLVLACGRSRLPPRQIPHLVDATGHFSDRAVLAGLKYQFSHAAQQELPLEIRAQLETFRATGLPLSHVDGHLHIHIHPIVLKHLLTFTHEFQIRVIRLPYEELRQNLMIDRSRLLDKLIRSMIFTPLCRSGRRLLRRHNIQFADRVYGLLQTSRMTEEFLLKLIPQIRSDVVEIYSHPSQTTLDHSFVQKPEVEELQALLSDRVRQLLDQHEFIRSSFKDLF